MRLVETLRRRRHHWLWCLLAVCVACARAIRDAAPAGGLTAIRRYIYDTQTLGRAAEVSFVP